MPGSPALWAATLALALVGAGACGDDKSFLATDPPVTTTTSTGQGGAGGEGGAGGAGGAGAGTPVEPAGAPKLTVVNGVNDHEAIRICFVPYPGSDGSGVLPWPSSAAGLPFAEGAAIAPIDAVAPPGEDVQIHVVAGDLGATAGLDCAEILALSAGGQGSVVAAALPVVPASAFVAERSLLLVPAGCLGGPGHSDPAEIAGCGPGYSAETPTASLVAAPMSRVTEADRIGFQVVHASAATPKVDVRLATAGDASMWLVAPGLGFGSIGPFPPFLTLDALELGIASQAEIRTYAPGQTTAPSSVVSMGQVLEGSAVSAADLVDGRGFVLVAVGAAPGVAEGPFWHALTYALVPADP